MGAFNQTGNIADGQPGIVSILDDPDLGMQRRKGIGRNLWARVGNSGQQRGFTRIGIADEADIGDNPQFKKEIPLSSLFTGLREAWRLASGGCEIPVAQPAASALAKDKALAVFSQISNQFAFDVWTARGLSRILIC